MVTALQFFMGSDEKEEDSDSDNEVTWVQISPKG